MHECREATLRRNVLCAAALFALAFSAACESGNPAAPSLTSADGGALETGVIVGEQAPPSRDRQTTTVPEGSITCELVRQGTKRKFRITGRLAQGPPSMDPLYQLITPGLLRQGHLETSRRGTFRTGWITYEANSWAEGEDVSARLWNRGSSDRCASTW